MDVRTSSNAHQTFRLLDLPPELRCMVYAHLDTHHRRTITMRGTDYANGLVATAILVLADPIPPIHLSCRLVHKEATSLLKGLVFARGPPRLLLPANCFVDLIEQSYILEEIIDMLYRSWVDGTVCIPIPPSHRSYIHNVSFGNDDCKALGQFCRQASQYRHRHVRDASPIDMSLHVALLHQNLQDVDLECFLKVLNRDRYLCQWGILVSLFDIPSTRWTMRIPIDFIPGKWFQYRGMISEETWREQWVGWIVLSSANLYVAPPSIEKVKV